MAENGNSSIFRPPVLTLEELPWMQKLGRIEDGVFTVETNWSGRRLRTPAAVPVERILAAGQEGVVRYVFDAILRERPRIIPFVFENRSLVEMAKHMKRRSNSPKTFYLYTHLLWHFSKWAGKKPDEIIADAKSPRGLPDLEKVMLHSRAIGDYVIHLQDRGLAPNRIANYIKAVKALYCANEIKMELTCSLPRRAVSEYRAPTVEDLQKLLKFAADSRTRLIILLLALGGFREGTLVKLRYRHVKHDLEAGILPLHIHVEIEITKGEYCNYDTFVGAEAAEELRSYLESRRRGSPDGKIPPEEITDESPLIRDSVSRTPKPIGEKQVYQLLHNLYFEAGLLKRDAGGHYSLRVHSLRKFFDTNLKPRGVQPDYVEYMMGHTFDRYNDVRSLGIEFLRGVYADADLHICPRPESKLSQLEQLKTFARGLGLNPEQCILGEAFAEPHRTVVQGGLEERQIALVSSAIKNAIKQEVLSELGFESREIHGWTGGAAEI